MALAKNDDENELNSLKKDYQLKFNSLRCHLNENDVHFLIDPKLLPCSNSACYECIKSTIVNGNDFKCPLCNQLHSNMNINELKTNNSLIDQIDLNGKEITNELVEKLNNYISNLTGLI